ncbi:hypothetical protein E2C01_027682 [Portunus trituberculatus]|uniref:Uncharacterized protein n=1 Tax=Portunus trituberculatus TaxID=210409 RepID=A0A5B7ELT8_PORTR|nr:hypothetical protein [Portunus trituberculatus]
MKCFVPGAVSRSMPGSLVSVQAGGAAGSNAGVVGLRTHSYPSTNAATMGSFATTGPTRSNSANANVHGRTNWAANKDSVNEMKRYFNDNNNPSSCNSSHVRTSSNCVARRHRAPLYLTRAFGLPRDRTVGRQWMEKKTVKCVNGGPWWQLSCKNQGQSVVGTLYLHHHSEGSGVAW